MPKFNINKLRSWGLRYIVRDYSGQLWAHEKPPVRGDGYWRIADEFLSPERPKGLYYFIDESTHKVVSSNQKLEQEYKDSCIKFWGRLYKQDRRVCVPLEDSPFDISWEDEPYDIVEHGIVAESDLKVWPEFHV